ncbi:AAA domain-containing protein [Tellurirhabdus rosea]|uniref:AAA domain-containing protein n=1 Tax=Tellurirhabdus rosea TaxID=2674997 RepID=UPI002255EF66|nr:AAA domain-containing protein [Tellurirhabdus rosea]
MVQKPILKAYARRLTNLSSRNRSLLLTSLPAEQFLDLHETDYRLNQPSFDIIRQLIGRKATVPVCEVLDPRDGKANDASRRLRRIARTAQFIEEERGAQDLYVGYPFVRGKFADGTPVHGPLLLFPVQLIQEAGRWLLRRRADEPVTLNRSFLLAYAHFSSLSAPEDLLEEPLDDYERDATAFRTQLYERLKNSPLRLDFNPDLFADRLQPFQALKKADLEQLEKNGELKLYPEAVLGILPQAGSYLVRDYEALEKEEGEEREEGGTEAALFPFPPSSLSSPSFKEEHLHTPLPLDASQEAALRRVRAGESLVVQGPPGTGKSQLIANLMADFAAQGKRVLLVCQKRVALDVVYERLRQVGMAPFTALIHDFKNDRRMLYEQLADQIERVEDYRKQNQGLDAVLLERTFTQTARQIDQTLGELQAFKDALFDESLCGVSAKELYLSSNPSAPTIALNDLYRQFPLNETGTFLQKLENYEAYHQRLAAPHPWQKRISFARFGLGDQAAIRQVIDEVVDLSGRLAEETLMQFQTPLSWQKATQLAYDRPALERIMAQTAEPLFCEILLRFARRKVLPEAENRLKRLLVDVAEAFEADPQSVPVPFADIPETLAVLRAGVQARERMLGWLFFGGKKRVTELAARCGYPTDATSLNRLILQLDRQQGLLRQVEAATTQLQLPSMLTDDAVRMKEAADRLYTAFWGASEAWQLLETRFDFLLPWLQSRTGGPSSWRGLQELTGWLLTVQTRTEAWYRLLTPAQLDALLRQPESMAAVLRESLEADFDLLVEADRLHESLTVAERTVLERLITRSVGDWPAVFQNSLRLAWLAYLEEQRPELRSVSSLRMQQLEKALQENVVQKQALSQQILGIRLREQIYRDLEYNRLNNLVTYRDLGHQVTKKRAVWPVRKLLEQFSDEIFQLVPCWLSSPESVSAIFPLRRHLFDVVVFDEASQCSAEYGIPALWRASRVVVTGDTKQLPPTDLYRVRFEPEPDEDTPPELEAESLLVLAARSFAQTTLRGHYRSRSPELIDFSNRQFYKNRLQLLPDFNHLARRQPAISYRNVGGLWQQQTNEMEARAVVDLIRQLQTEEPAFSVGVVTFNFPQQQLILDLLEGEALPLPGTTVEGLFVKNIENVQGDERDIIIFSVGYAPDERGRIAAQFGTLNLAGGENRLNVAVTRARERIYVITSVQPAQLPVEQTLNEGPKLLRAYLEYALTVSEGRYRPQPHTPERLPTGRLLKDYLKTEDATLTEELPFADLTRKSQHAYSELVLTDDALYFESTVKEAHAYLPLSLQTKNWPFRRVFSRVYWQKRT